MFSKLVILFLQIFAVAVLSFPKPDKPCEISDDACVTKLTRDIFAEALTGDPKDGFEVIDPMHHDLITASLLTTNFNLTDVTVIGLKSLEVQSTKITDHGTVDMVLMVPHYEISGNYQIIGDFLTTPVKGSGKFTVKGDNIKLNLEVKKYFYKKDGKVHSKAASFNFTTEQLGKVQLEADNLVEGNKEMGDAALKLINSNYKVLTTLWSPPISMANLNKVFKNFNLLLARTPLFDVINEHPSFVNDKE